jgi:hypothetical protein
MVVLAKSRLKVSSGFETSFLPPEAPSDAVPSAPMHASYYACVIEMSGQFFIPREKRENTLSEKENDDDR